MTDEVSIDRVFEELRARYGVTVAGGARLPGGYDTYAESWRLTSDRGALVLRIDRGVSLRTAGWLAQAQGVAQRAGGPSQPPWIAHDGTTAFRVADATVTERAFADGATLPRDDPHAVHTAGATLGALHRAGQDGLAQRPTPSPWHGELWRADRDPPGLRDPDLDRWHETLVSAHRESWAHGLVHGDFYAGNILCAAGVIVAVIDWSEARLDMHALELAWATWEFGHDDCCVLDVDRARTFLAGYREAHQLPERLADVFVGLMRVELRRNARYTLDDPEELEYNAALQHAFGNYAVSPQDRCLSADPMGSATSRHFYFVADASGPEFPRWPACAEKQPWGRSELAHAEGAHGPIPAKGVPLIPDVEAPVNAKGWRACGHR